MADHAASRPMPGVAHPRSLHLVQRGQPNVDTAKRVSRVEIVILAPLLLLGYVVGGLMAGPILGLLYAVDDVQRCWRKA